ncbi:MAG: glycosyltransferase family 4 protein [Opitutaceae bacterium]|nr:glycosyltransferase family 4 protein [Opitutaceae bacterium]
MRVLITTPYDLAVPGGVNRHALDLLETLTCRGVVAKLVGPASTPVFKDDVRIHRIGRVWVGALNGARSRVTLDLGIGGEVRHLIREFQPEVIHLQEPFLPTLNSFVLRHAGAARRVGTFHTYSETSRGYLWAWPWCRWVNARLDARVAVSGPARDFATRWHPADFTVVPNGVRLPSAGAGRAERPVGRPARVLFVGRADEPRKGFTVLREAMRRLETETPGTFALEAVGPATERGMVGAAELAAAYAAADVCAVPSLGGESFGLVALEALAHGVPVVASRIRGYAEWLDGAGVGELAAPGDPAALAEAIRRLADDAAGHADCARRAREVAARYDWERVAERLIRIYEGAASSNEEG